MTTGEISAHLLEVYGANVGTDTVNRITDKIVEEMQAWWARPLEKVYAAILIDAIVVKVRDGQVANQPFYAAIGVDLYGHKDILGVWASGNSDGESAKYWLDVLTELRNRGVADVFFIICDGLKGLPDSVAAAFPKTIVQTCLIHLIRNTFRYASRKYWDQISRDLKPVYTAPTVQDAVRARDEFLDTWGRAYPAIKGLWLNAWEEFTPFLAYGVAASYDIVGTLHAPSIIRCHEVCAPMIEGFRRGMPAALAKSYWADFDWLAHEARSMSGHVGPARIEQPS